MRDPEHARTLLSVFGNALTVCPESQEWFAWLERILSFAFEGREGRFTARCETKQRGERYWIAYQRVEGKLLKRYLARPATSLQRNWRRLLDQSAAPGLHHPLAQMHQQRFSRS